MAECFATNNYYIYVCSNNIQLYVVEHVTRQGIDDNDSLNFKLPVLFLIVDILLKGLSGARDHNNVLQKIIEVNICSSE